MDVQITNTDFTVNLFLLSVLQDADVTANTMSVGLNSLGGHEKLKLEMCERNGQKTRALKTSLLQSEEWVPLWKLMVDQLNQSH